MIVSGMDRLICEAERKKVQVAFENLLSIREFLRLAYQKAKRLDEMRNAEK